MVGFAMKMRVGLGYDVHPFDDSRQLILGGVVLDSPGLAGHSDGDVVSHAICDAILSVAGEPDLGALFPASDPQWGGASSLMFVEESARRVSKLGWKLANVDVVICAETPSLTAYISSMVENLNSALTDVAAEPSIVSIKAKRGEGIGFVGRAEGIACYAVALLEAH